MAKSYKKTIVLGLDYSEFEGGITACNREMKTLDAEFALMQSQMDGCASKAETMAAKEEYLTQKIYLQQKKMEAAKEKYNALMDAHADTDKISRADQALLKERTTLEKLQNQLEDTQIAQSNFKENATALIGILGTIAGSLLACVKSASEYADTILTMSPQSSIATDTLQGWIYASELVDVSVETMTGSLQKMEKNMESAAKGSGTAYDAFKKLGVSVLDSGGQMKDAETIFLETIDALGEVKNATEQDQLAMDIFGKSAASLTGVIDAGSEGMAAYKKEAEELGRIMSEDDLKAAGAFDDAMQKLESAFESLKNSAGAKVIPALTGIIEAIASIPTPVLGVIVTLVTTITTLVMFAKTINSAMEAGKGLSKIFKGVGSTMDSTYAKVLLMVVALTALATVIAVIIGKTSDIERTASSIGNLTGGASVPQGGKPQTGYNASGTKSWRGGATWVGENGPEIVDLPPGSRIYNNKESTNIAGDTIYNVQIMCDLDKMRSVSDVVDAIEGLGASAQCGG